jgi:hypothetical protein
LYTAIAQSGHIAAHTAQLTQASSSVHTAVKYPFLLRFSFCISTIFLGHDTVQSPHPLHSSNLTVIFFFSAISSSPFAVKSVFARYCPLLPVIYSTRRFDFLQTQSVKRSKLRLLAAESGANRPCSNVTRRKAAAMRTALFSPEQQRKVKLL